VTELAQGHESLRSGFASLDGQRQVTVLDAAEVHVPVEVIDCSGAHGPAASARVAALCAECASRPFDLAAPPLLRAWLLRLGPQEHVALLVLHHIVADGWSVGLLIQEMGALYAAFAAGQPVPLALPALQYGDFAAWQAQWLASDAAAAQRRWWVERLAALTPLELPTDHPRPAQPNGRGGTCAWRVPAAVAASLRQIGRREGATPFMTLLTAFAVLLARYSGQHDIAIGAPVAQRNRRDLEPLVGMLANTLVLRCDLSGRPGFIDALRRVRDFTSEALARQDLPFEEVVRAVAPQRDGRGNPLFQVAFTMEGLASEPLTLPGLTLERLDVDSGTAKFDLLLNVGMVGDELHGAFEYASDLFDAATVARMAGHFSTLLEAIAADPRHDIATLPLLGGDELAQLARWNDTARAYPRGASIAQCVARQAQATPRAIALAFDDAVLSYRALEARAERLAWRLHDAGVRPGMPVALHAPRSAAMVVAMLAILKAGGFYVPLDPAYPRERLLAMLADCGAQVLLAPADLAGALGADVSVLDLQDDPQAAPRPPLAPEGVHGESLAYAIYTSGSTGAPKGVAVPQRAVLRLVLNTNYVSLGPGDHVAQASNASFDAATFEIWGALLNGARLVGAAAEVVLSPPRLAAWLREQGITTLWLTTSLFNQVAREVPTAFATLRDLLVGGEALNAQCLREVLHAGAPQRLLNGYGPTENTTFSTWKLVREVAPEATTVPIGQPVANTQAHVLDAHQQLVPIGVVGELYLGGDGLAAGYLGRPQETAERFVPNPLDQGRTRLYRSGDIVRRRADGDLEFIGRRDHQVKIRGFRVELGEIEAALLRQAGVRDAVVLARQDRPGPRELVAYLVPSEGAQLVPAELRQSLAQSLPAHMLPARWVLLPRCR
jgi:amino acid adenylation domain-containing protein